MTKTEQVCAIRCRRETAGDVIRCWNIRIAECSVAIIAEVASSNGFRYFLKKAHFVTVQSASSAMAWAGFALAPEVADEDVETLSDYVRTNV